MRVGNEKYNNAKRIEIIFLCVIISGIIAGTIGFLIAYSDSASDYVMSFKAASEYDRVDWLLHFLKSFLGNSVFVLLIFVCGFSGIMQPCIFAVLFAKGLGLGISVCAFYSCLGIDGMLNSFVLIVLPGLFYVFAVIIAAREAMSMSTALAKSIFTQRNFIGFKDSSRLYMLKFLFLEGVVALGAVCECLCNIVCCL